MRVIAFRMSFVACLAGCLLAAGCDGPSIHHVSGNVSYDGKPLPAGVIYFDPDFSKQNDGPQGYAVIQNGTYNTADEGGMGVAGGAYVARIEGFDGQPGNELPLGNPLFSDYRQPVDLPKEAAKQNFEVSRRAP